MDRFTDWVLRHRLLVALGWLAVAVAGGAPAPTTVDRLSYDFALPGQPAYETNAEIADASAAVASTTRCCSSCAATDAGTQADAAWPQRRSRRVPRHPGGHRRRPGRRARSPPTGGRDLGGRGLPARHPRPRAVRRRAAAARAAGRPGAGAEGADVELTGFVAAARGRRRRRRPRRARRGAARRGRARWSCWPWSSGRCWPASRCWWRRSRSSAPTWRCSG